MPAGVSVQTMSSGLSTGSGTLGCYLVNEAYPDLFMLSNNHVLAAENRARAGDPVIQGKAPALAQLFRFPLLANYERSDCAVARLLNRGHEGGTSPNAVKAIIDVFAPPQDLGQWIGTETADCAIAIAPLPGSSLPALVALHIDAPAGENRGYLRVGRGLQNSGIVSQ